MSHYNWAQFHASLSQATQVGAGQGGEGAGERQGPPKKGKSLGREPHHRWSEEMRESMFHSTLLLSNGQSNYPNISANLILAA